MSAKQNKKKIINDPVFGFFNIQSDLVFDLLEHPWIQRLRRIRQLGLSFLVYPGANHTRFEHSVGAVHLMAQAIASLRLKGHNITDEEAEAAMAAIFLHDIGHGPFSHLLENSLVDVNHEQLSAIIIEQLNNQLDNRLDLALQIFENRYHKTFLHQLVAGQLDMDRLDYLARDSFYTGVAEGVVGIDRIIKMLEIEDDRLVVEAKGVYSIEKFLIARRLMYWQVYLHKTVMAADSQLINTLRRANDLVSAGGSVFSTPSFRVFLENRFTKNDFKTQKAVDGKNILDYFMELDDIDIWSSIKVWQSHPDFILSYLAKGLIQRRLFAGQILTKPAPSAKLNELQAEVCRKLAVSPVDAGYFITHKEVSNSAYSSLTDNIFVLDKNRHLSDINKASDINLSVLTKLVRKFFISYPKELVFN